MFHRIVFIVFAFLLLTTTPSCNNSSSKIPCPTYADSTPQKKSKHVTPGSQKPEIPKATKARSGVLPTDGRGTRTKVPR